MARVQRLTETLGSRHAVGAALVAARAGCLTLIVRPNPGEGAP